MARRPPIPWPDSPAAATALVGALLGALAAPAPAGAEFVEATAEAGFWGSQPTWGAQIVDLDGDGDLDLFNAHHFYSGYVFTNEGNGHFTVWGMPQPIGTPGDRHGYLWVDLDGDGEVDGVCSHGGDGGCGCSDDGNELWRGTGDGVLEAVAGAGGMADTAGRGRAFSAADIDGDGDLDLFHGKAPLDLSPNSLYRNDGNLTFVDVAAAWGVDEQEGTVGSHFVDFDDDGDPDLFVGGEEDLRPTALFRNDGGTFVDATVAAFGGPLPVVAGADWGDCDGDGDLDLALAAGAEGIWDTWGVTASTWWLFANHRLGDDGVDEFRVSTPGESPVAVFRWNGYALPEMVYLGPLAEHPENATVVLDDAYVGPPTFTPGVDHGIWVWRDRVGGPWEFRVSAPPGTYGNFTVQLSSVGGPVAPSASNLEIGTVPNARAQVWRNDGGTFTEIGGSLGLTASVNPRGITWVDFDNDGDLDLHQTNKGTVEMGNEPDVLWRNDGATFTALVGAGWPEGLPDHLGDGGVWGDLDRDGDPDLFLQEGAGPAFFSMGTPARFYRNDGPAGHWLTWIPGPATGGGTPVGVRATAWTGGARVHRRLTANSWRGFQPPLELHFGLGEATVVDSLVVEWPGGGRQVLIDLAADRVLAFGQDEDPTTVGPPAAVAPADAWAGPLVPQPARGDQRIRLAPPRPGTVGVRVYDVRGRLVRTLLPARRLDEPITLAWDGRDDAGRRVPAGVYFVRGEGAYPFQRKAVRLR